MGTIRPIANDLLSLIPLVTDLQRISSTNCRVLTRTGTLINARHKIGLISESPRGWTCQHLCKFAMMDVLF